jgi:hypothetical protein
MEEQKFTLASIELLVINNRIKEALEALRQWFEDNGYRKEKYEVIQQLSRWNEIKVDERNDTATPAELRVKKNKLTKATLDLLLLAEDKATAATSSIENDTQPITNDSFAMMRAWSAQLKEQQQTANEQPNLTNQELPTYLHDDFLDNRNSWNIGDLKMGFSLFGSNNYGRTSIENHQCLIDSNYNGSINVVLPMNINRFQPFAIETTVQYWSGNDFGFGLTWGINLQTYDAYYFFINHIGRFCIGHLMNGQSINLANWLYSPHIRTGNSKNKLRLYRYGDQVHFYINDQLVYTTPYYTFFGEYIGMTTVNQKKVTYDYFTVWN